MDENAIKLLLAEYKNDMIAQMKESEKAIKESVKTDIKESEKTIRTDIEVIKADVASNRSELEKLKERVDVIEVKQKSDKVVIDNVKKESDTGDEIAKIMTAARCCIGLKPITLEDINEVANKARLNGMAALRESVKEFFMDELKMDDE